MMPFFLHPARRSLARFAVGDAFGGRSRVARHLERCSECRRFVGFTQRFARAAAAVPAPVPSEGLLARALADRAAGARVILPAPLEPPRPRLLRHAVRASALMALAVLLGLWWSSRPVRDDFASANELLLAGFAPTAAEAGQAGRSAGALTHRLRPIAVTYLRRFRDSASGRTTDAGEYDLRVTPADSNRWLLTSAWREIAGRDDMHGAHAWTESVTVADSALAPASRVVHVTPYRRWAGILIDQRFRNDSVVGLMSLDEDPTRRPIARDLRGWQNRLIASDALGPVYFIGVPLLSGAEFDLGALGWAVVARDVFVPMHLRVVGAERIETPAGPFDCWKFAIRVGDETHYHWVRQSDHLGVRTVRRLRDGRTRELILLREDPTR